MTETLPQLRLGPLQWTGQIVMYALFAAFVGYFASQPPVSLLPPGHGLLRLSFSHPGKFATDCRQRSAEELAKMPPQMRAAQDCQRTRSPVQARVEVDDKVLIDRSFRPAGLAQDGAASGYWRTPIAAGTHRLRIQFKDDLRADAPTYERRAEVTVREGQIVLIDFKADQGGISIR